MARKHSLEGRYRRRGVGALGVLAYLTLCGGLSFIGTSLAIKTGDARSGNVSQLLQDVESPIATIQLSPGLDDRCQRLLFNNESGRYQYGGAGDCANLTAWVSPGSPGARRSDALVQAFKYR